MTDLQHHYKERTPEETVQIIIDFFHKHGFEPKETDMMQSEAGTWSSHVDLYKGDIRLEGSNGKGMTEAYCRASGYAELYERFCNGMFFGANPYWNRILMETNQKKHGYYLRPDEKILSYDELTTCCKRMEMFLEHFMWNDPRLIKSTFDLITNGVYVGVPMQNIGDPNDIIYIDPRVLLRVTRSVGMAAGNTVTEALNQGLSELVEKEAFQQLVLNWGGPHYALKLENIKNNKLQEIITNIHNEGYDFYLFDLSYSYKVPTMMSLLVDKKYNVLNINLGSFPVFDIATERVLTELYQGIKSYRDFKYKSRLQLPFKNYTTPELHSIYANSITGEVISSDFFRNIEYKDDYNHEVFIDSKHSNEEILQYYIQLAKDKGYKFYYLNNSLCDEVTAVHIMCDGEDVYTGNEMCHIEWNEIEIPRTITYINNLKKLYDGIYNNNLDYSALYDILQCECNDYIGIMRLWNDFLISANNSRQLYYLEPLLIDLNEQDLFSTDNDAIDFNLRDSLILAPFKKYLTLRKYLINGTYDKNELLYIFNNIFNFNITEEDIKYGKNSNYLIKKVYVEPMHNYLVSDDYKEIIATYVK